ncbi:MAG: hypothetical protein ACI93R_003632 [Flavobacteriales bacterium]|jgi:hypothetical protein
MVFYVFRVSTELRIVAFGVSAQVYLMRKCGVHPPGNFEYK